MQIRLAFDARKLTDYGIGTYVSNLVLGLGRRPEVRLTLITRAGQEEQLRSLAPSARLVSTTAQEYTAGELVQLPWLLLREQVDLIHFPHYVVPPLLMRPVVATVHDVIQLFYLPQRRRLALRYLRTMMRAALRRSRRVITVSRSSRDDLLNLFGADPRRLLVIHNGVDEAWGERPPPEVIDELRQRYRLKPPLVLVVGNDKPHKNLETMLRAYALAVRRHRVPGQLVLIGGPDQGSPLAQRAASLGLQQRVRFLGRLPQQDLIGLSHVAAVLLHVALYEGFGLPILEAMRAGLPVITSNLGAMQELGEDCARLVNPLDVDEIAGAIERVLVDDPLRRLMIEAGRQRAESMTWERTVEGTIAAYRQALGEVQR